MTSDRMSKQPAQRYDFLIRLAGAATTLAVVALNLLITRTLSFNLLSLSYWFVLPGGALIGGLGAASGYYFAAKVTHAMPSRRLLVDMVLIGGAAWYTYHWLDYYTARLDDGTAVRGMLSFWEYFVFKAEHTHLSLIVQHRQVGDSGELGALGYVREFLQFAGFLAGGLAAYVFLRDQEVCENCLRYTKNSTLLYGASADTVDEVFEQGGVTLSGIVDEAQQTLRERPLGLRPHER